MSRVSLALVIWNFSDSFAAVRCIGKASVISHGVHKAWKEIAEFGQQVVYK